MIVFDQLTYAYPHSQPVFQDFSWQVPRGEAWAVLGPSGCGKTTLLYLLAGLRFPVSGRVLVDGQLITRPRPQSGLILQEYGLLPWATVTQNAALGLRIRNFYGPDGTHAPRDFRPKADVTPWLERLGLLDHAEKYPNQLSGGQRQRTAIARTLALRPDLLLMDEPFASLDAPTRESLQALTLELQAEQGLTLIIVTHAIEEAAFIGRKILLLSPPPNTCPIIIETGTTGKPEFRNSEVYQVLCRDLRRRLEGLGS
jgi:ABC-type nitrate/sulfonate/bicarbonate transport system ATPase subunit